jgi:hypothetical protein
MMFNKYLYYTGHLLGDATFCLPFFDCYVDLLESVRLLTPYGLENSIKQKLTNFFCTEPDGKIF